MATVGSATRLLSNRVGRGVVVTMTRGSSPRRSPNMSMSQASGYRQAAISSHHAASVLRSAGSPPPSPARRCGPLLLHLGITLDPALVIAGLGAGALGPRVAGRGEPLEAIGIALGAVRLGGLLGRLSLEALLRLCARYRKLAHN